MSDIQIQNKISNGVKLKTKILVILPILFLSVFSSLSLAMAQGTQFPNGKDPNATSGNNSGNCIPDDLCQTVGKTEYCRINGLCVIKPEGNGLRGSSTVFEVVAIVLRWLLTLAGVVATVFVIIGGYLYITAAGNEEQSEKGRKTLINAIIGIVVVVLSIAIVTIITNTLGSTEPLGFFAKNLV